MKKLIVLAFIIAACTLLLRQQPSQAQTTSWQYIYLPMVEKGEGVVVPTETPIPTETATPIPTATSTATASPTATATSCNGWTQGLQNTSFETGWVPWTTSGLAVRSSTFATAGSWSALLGGYNNALDVIAQPAFVPGWTESAAVYFSEIMFSTDAQYTPYDLLKVRVVDLDIGTVLAEAMLSNTGVRANWITWKVPVNNVANYRGRALLVMVGATTDSTYSTSWYVDQVWLVFACGSTPAGPKDALDITINIQSLTPSSQPLADANSIHITPSP